jgi:hypothetical protein
MRSQVARSAISGRNPADRSGESGVGKDQQNDDDDADCVNDGSHEKAQACC